jgi:Regulator of ribonuclease activity B
MSWLYLFLALCAALAVGRIGYQIKKLRERPNDDWDARLIERLRRGGADPFRAIDIDFFLALPSEAAAAAVSQQLVAEGFRVDTRAIAESTDHPFSVHAIKSMQLNADGIRAASARMRVVAAAEGGRFDGWTASQGGS